MTLCAMLRRDNRFRVYKSKTKQTIASNAYAQKPMFQWAVSCLLLLPATTYCCCFVELQTYFASAFNACKCVYVVVLLLGCARVWVPMNASAKVNPVHRTRSCCYRKIFELCMPTIVVLYERTTLVCVVVCQCVRWRFSLFLSLLRSPLVPWTIERSSTFSKIASTEKLNTSEYTQMSG